MADRRSIADKLAQQDAIRQGIVDTANSLGMDPASLATIISYETGGTFDPTKRGPRTKWGQHRGLIQFGEPQARQFGVDWKDPIGSQLGPEGAIANYYRSRGWRPGMSELDAYSIVNAGAPGRYNARDAAAGGAPGTVADKVRGQFAPHRAKAAAFLGSIADKLPVPAQRPDISLAAYGGPRNSTTSTAAATLPYTVGAQPGQPQTGAIPRWVWNPEQGQGQEVGDDYAIEWQRPSPTRMAAASNAPVQTDAPPPSLPPLPTKPAPSFRSSQEVGMNPSFRSAQDVGLMGLPAYATGGNRLPKFRAPPQQFAPFRGLF